MSEWQRSPSEGQVLNRARETVKRQIRVAFPAIVRSYDPATQTADLQIETDDFIEAEDGSIVPHPFPVIPHVPVAFPSGGGFRLAFPLQKGDPGQVICCDLSIDEWQSLGGLVSPPADKRRHALSDAIFYPGAKPDTAAFPDSDPAAVTLGQTGGLADLVATANRVKATLDALNDIFQALVPANVVNGSPDATWGTLKTALASWATGSNGSPSVKILG